MALTTNNDKRLSEFANINGIKRLNDDDKFILYNNLKRQLVDAGRNIGSALAGVIWATVTGEKPPANR